MKYTSTTHSSVPKDSDSILHINQIKCSSDQGTKLDNKVKSLLLFVIIYHIVTFRKGGFADVSLSELLCTI